MFDLRSKITIKVLRYFFTNIDGKEYVSELARILSVDKGNLDRKLKELERDGLLLSDVQGNQKYYFLNKNYVFLNEVKSIYNNKYGVNDRLKVILKEVSGIKEAYIFGSFVNEDFQAESDIDVLIIGKHSAIEVQKVVLNLENM